MLSANELSQMRTDLNQSLPDSGTIQRLSLAADGMGGGTSTWTNVGTASCRIMPVLRLPVSGIIASRVAEVQEWIITFPQGTNIGAADRVASGGRSFEIVDTRSAHSYELSCRMVAREVT